MTVTTGTEALVRRAYHLAEGDVLDVQGFIDLRRARRGTGVSNWAMWSSGWASCSRRSPGAAPGHVLGDVVAIEVSIRGTFLGPFETPAGVIQPTGTKLDIPTADFRYVRDGS